MQQLPGSGENDQARRQLRQFRPETVLALKPDLVIGWRSGNVPASLDKLRALGFPVYVSQVERIEDVPAEIERFGVLAGSSEIGNAAAKRFRERIAGLQQRYSSRPRVRTFYQI
ncbi:MAG: ABC transporter substrate-binding protein [Propionivibrio sp.]|nr:ABC transporter substrate-binding protein [Propionivibrio sp.]